MSFSNDLVLLWTVCLVCQMWPLWFSLTWSVGPSILLTRLLTAEELVEGLQDAHNNLSDLLSTLPQKNVKISSAERPNSDILVFWGSQDCFSTDSCFVHCWIWGAWCLPFSCSFALWDCFGSASCYISFAAPICTDIARCLQRTAARNGG